MPQDGTTCEIGPVAIFKGAAHPNAAKLFVEYALSPDCVELAAENGSYQFLVIDNAKQPDGTAMTSASQFRIPPRTSKT